MKRISVEKSAKIMATRLESGHGEIICRLKGGMPAVNAGAARAAAISAENESWPVAGVAAAWLGYGAQRKIFGVNNLAETLCNAAHGSSAITFHAENMAAKINWRGVISYRRSWRCRRAGWRHANNPEICRQASSK